MELRNRLSDAIVLMAIVTLWSALLMVAAWLAFGWMVESFGRDVAVVTVFALGGVVAAIVLWVASSRHTTAIWRAALNYAADTQEQNVQAMRGLASVQREDARRLRLHEQVRGQIELAGYRSALASARQNSAAPAQTWLPPDDSPGDVNWVE